MLHKLIYGGKPRGRGDCSPTHSTFYKEEEEDLSQRGGERESR
jgi:hypothetical protein